MNLQQRLLLLKRLGEYLISPEDSWQEAKDKATRENAWFTPEFINLQASNIARRYLSDEALQRITTNYNIPAINADPKTIGIIMAGNIPLVGFHDFLCVFLSGHKQVIRLSSKDTILLRHLISQMTVWDNETADLVSFADMLKGCDAYIATGSNNSSRYFEYYFSKYPHIIRRNRTSVAILDGHETPSELSALADDVYQFFGLGCRNVTRLYVPRDYDFISLLESFKKYNHLFEHNKYKNNYDYQLAILIINKKFYMTNGSVILSENPGLFSPISVLHYEYYDNRKDIENFLANNHDVQCLVGHGHLDFGKAQEPDILDFADGVDTMKFLMNLNSRGNTGLEKAG